MQVTWSDEALKIDAVSHQDAGHYKCIAKNTAGVDTKEFRLIIQGKSVD